MKKIAVLTSGGDAPGMNACVRAVTRAGIYYGLEVYGVEAGYQGLVDGNFTKLGVRDVGNIIQQGGTMLKTSRCKSFMTRGGFAKAVNNLKNNGIDCVITIGGDGTFHGALELKKAGINVIGIPATIDNDLGYTDYCLGFDTAVNTVVDALNNIRDTSMAHERLCVVEVMGRNCGDIALNAGIGAGAEVILVPEVKYPEKEYLKKLVASNESGKKGSIVVVAEGVAKADEILAKIKKHTKLEGRAMSLEYVQRGGAPTARDRVLGSQFGLRAIELLLKGKSGVLLGVEDDKIFDMEIEEALGKAKSLDLDKYRLTDIISI